MNEREWIDLYYTAVGISDTPELMGVRFGDGIFVKNVLARKEAPYVKNPAEEEIYKRIDKGLLVVKGPKGDGLSVATIVALARKILHDRVTVVNTLASVSCLNDVARLRSLTDFVRERRRGLIVYLDLSRPGQYTRKPWEAPWYMPNGLNNFAYALEVAQNVALNENVAVVVVLSDDLYEVLKHKLKSYTTVEVNSGDVKFLRELVQAYSGCGEDVAAQVAEAVAKHDCGRAVLATLAADWLSRHSCQNAEEALKAAEEKAKEFIADYIWYAVLNDKGEYANLHAPLILLRYFEGPMSAEAAEEFLISLGAEKYKVRGSLAARWIAMRHCGLIEETIKNEVETVLSGTKVEKDLYYELRSAFVGYYKHFKAKGYLK